MDGYYYKGLDRAEKTAYEQMKTGLEALAPSIRVARLESERMAEVYLRLKLDTPLLFYVVGYSYRYYPGAAHGMPFRETVYIDRRTGETLELEEFISISKEELDERVRDAFREVAAQEPEEFSWSMEFLEEISDFADYSYLGEDGVIFYRPPYELASYARGFVEITIPYEDLGMGEVVYLEIETP